MQFRNKPRVIEAEQFFPDKPLPFSPQPIVCLDVEGTPDRWYVITAHLQRAYLAPGDWVVLEGYPKYAAYPIKPDIFEATYEPVDAGAGTPQG